MKKQSKVSLTIPCAILVSVSLLAMPNAFADGQKSSSDSSSSTGKSKKSAGEDISTLLHRGKVFSVVSGDEVHIFKPIEWVDREETLAAFQDTQDFAKQVIIDWIGASSTNPKDKKLTIGSLSRLQKFDGEFKQGSITIDNLDEKIRQQDSTSASETLAYLSDAVNSLTNVQTQLTAFRNMQDNVSKLVVHQTTFDVRNLTPGAILVTLTYRMPKAVDDFFRGFPKFGPVLSWLAQDNYSLAVVARPWKVVVYDRRVKNDKGELQVKRSYIYNEIGTKLWVYTDALGKASPEVNKVNFQVGAGFILGPIQNLETFGGIFGGSSLEANVLKVGAVNLQIGGLVKDAGNDIVDSMNGYFILSKAVGLKAEGTTVRANYGGVIPIEQVANWIKGTSQLTIQGVAEAPKAAAEAP